MNVCSALTTCIYNLSESVVPCDASNINIISLRRQLVEKDGLRSTWNEELQLGQIN